MKTGKLPARHDPRTILFEDYTNPKLGVPEVDTDDLHRFTDWGMCGNGPDDTVEPGFTGAGDCVWAGGDHETMDWLSIAGQNPKGLFNGRTAIQDYSAVTGYKLGDEATDNGTNVLDALNYRRHTGLVDTKGHRHKIAGYAALEPGNTQHVKEAIHVFDAVGVGFLFPDYAMDQFNRGKPWSLMPGPTPQDGHYVSAIGYDRRYLYVLSWGRVQPMTWSFFRRLCDEAYGIYSLEFLKAGRSPEGFDVKALQADLAAL